MKQCLLGMKKYYIHKLKVAVVSIEDQASWNSSMEGEAVHGIPSLTTYVHGF